MLDLKELYQDLILNHCRHPHHFGELSKATHQAIGFNPICGDDVKIYLNIQDNFIKKIQFTGNGCAISLSSASMMTDALEGKSIEQVHTLFQSFHELLTKDSPEENNQTILGKLSVFVHVKEYPMRIKCATLPWHTLKAALLNSQNIVTTEGEDE